MQTESANVAAREARGTHVISRRLRAMAVFDKLLKSINFSRA
jgi:hypothetical protein